MLLVLTSTARADDACTGADAALCARSPAAETPYTLALHSRTLGGADGPPTTLHPYRALHAEAFPTARLGFFAQGEGFSLSPRTALFDVQGGAVLRLDEGFGLTASYRMLGFGLEGSAVASDIAAPFIGLVLDY